MNNEYIMLITGIILSIRLVGGKVDRIVDGVISDAITDDAIGDSAVREAAIRDSTVREGVTE